MGWVIVFIFIGCVLAFFGLYCYGCIKLFKKHFLAGLTFLVAPYIVYGTVQYYWYLAAVPAAIDVSYSVAIGDESGFRESCGVAVYKLSGATLKNIEAKGLRFFDGATQARGHGSDPYYKYENWKETPVPTSWTKGDATPWNMCSVISSHLIEKIIEAAKEKRSYYTTKDEGQLIVIPSLGLVVFSHYG